ncbi:hypothetical protein AJU45_02970 [Listeria monocytogenes]|nr:hypothetical protein AJU45_02970 [Listeria monocytogenes]
MASAVAGFFCGTKAGIVCDLKCKERCFCDKMASKDLREVLTQIFMNLQIEMEFFYENQNLF